MATIRAYTDISQSKKLAEILPLESADMAYYFMKDSGHLVSPSPFVLDGTEEKGDGIFTYLNCWSLAALLGVLPVIIGDVLSENALRLRIDKSETDFNVWYDNLDSGMVEEGLDIIESNPIDACVAMIEKLHELKML